MIYSTCASFCVFSLCIVLTVSYETTNDASSEYCGQKMTCAIYMDFAVEAIGKAKNSSFTCQDTTVKCGQREDLMSFLEVADEMINKAKIIFPTRGNCYTLPQIQDCSDLTRMGDRSSGVYTISTKKKLINKEVFDVYCDMETDGGGWTVIQRRGDFQNPIDYFFKDWKCYKEGFGDLNKEFWLGNDKIFALTNQDIYLARFDLVDIKNNTRYAQYETFWIDDENSKYTLRVTNFSGDIDDSMPWSNNQKFSTRDQDNDAHKTTNCAQFYRGGWWFSNCFSAHLNGENFKEFQTNKFRGKIWNSPNQEGMWALLARTEIKIRPKNFTP